MKRPVLLSLEKDRKIEQTVFKDLNLGAVFNEKTQAVLSHPCSKNELLERHIVFEQMKRDSVFDGVVACRSAIADLRREIILWQEARTKFEKFCLRLSVLDLYLVACQSLCNLQGAGRLHEVAYYFQDKNDAKMCKAITEAKLLLQSMSNAKIDRLNNQYVLSKLDSEKTLFEEICDCAKTLNICYSKKEYSAIYPDEYISNAVFALYKEEADKIENLIAPFVSIDFEEVISYLPELDFFLQIEEFGRKAEKKQLTRCIPTVSETRQFVLKEMYDFTLFSTLSRNIVPNNTYFSKEEPFFFLVGANGGGKTTYLRAIGSNLILFLAGCPVFAQSCVGYPFGGLRTHYPVDERFTNIGRLDDEKRRVNEMLSGDITDVFFLFNETFSGTNQEKGYALVMDVVENLHKQECFGLFVTHFHQVRETRYPVLSAVVENDVCHSRTYKITYAGLANGSYAEDILKKYQLDRMSLAEKLKTAQKDG
jgi:DNA mismatch repair ATPase MutS